jgi:predicted outer membrane repeat protein
MSILKKFFGKVSRQHSQRSSRPLTSRKLRMECLENRELLSVTLGSISDFDELRSHYSDLNLSANQTDYGIIEIQGSDFTEQGLRTAITLAGTTNKEDIIVFRTTSSQNTLNLAAQVDISTATAALGTNMKGIIFVGLGSENLTINANNNRAFKISSVDVAFAGVKIENGRIATASTSATTLTSLTATTTAGNGGAIYAQNSNIKIIDSTFSSNKSAGNYGSGGAIFSWGGSLTLIDSVFTANQTIATSASYGGAVYIVGANATIENTVFNNNTGYYGGGITAGMGANISVSANSVFSHNNSTKEGAGIYVMNGQLTVADSEISQNNSKSHGAGIYQKVGNLTITGSVVAENNAVTSTSNPTTTTADGGGIFAGGSVSITDTTIRDNFAGTGAGLYMDTNNTTMIITGSQILNNTATHAAGGVYNGGTETTSTFTIQNSTITGNTAGTASLTTTSYYGGGVYSTAALTVLQSTISNNTASGSGGGIYSTAPTTLTKATLNGNKSLVGNGGGLYTNDKATISASTFNENTAKLDGGGVYVGASSEIKSSYFQGNEALSDGGGIFATSTKSKLENSVIAGNHAATYGGGVYGHFDSIINATIVGNIAEKAGGGWYMPSSTLAASVLTNSILAYNVAKGTSSTYGGPDIRTVTANKLNVSYSLIYDQSAGNGKGYVNSGNNLAATTNPNFVSFPTSAITTSTAWSSTLWRNWNLQLSAGSPAIDAGNNAVVTEIYDVHGYGYDRINNSKVDLGAYEFGSIPDPPSPPASVSANVVGSDVTLTWTAVTGATRYSIVRQNPDGSTAPEIFVNATGYNVFRRVAGTTSWTQVNSQPLTDTEFVDATPPLGSVEYYVTAIRGTNTSSYNTTNATVGLATPVVTAEVETSGEVTITWDAVNNATRYSVWVKVAGGTWTQLSNNAAGESFVHTNPTVGAVQYAVKAHNGTVVSGIAAVTVNVPAPSSGTTTLPPFGAPVVNATLQSDGAVSITWGEVEDATRYSVWYQETGGSWVSLSSNATGSFIHTNPPSGTVKYAVKAHNGTVASGIVAVTLSIP